MGLFAAPQAAVYFGAHRSVLVAGQQDIEEGEQVISFEALHECGPPVGEDRSDLEAVVEDEKVSGQRGDELEHCVGAELVQDRCLAIEQRLQSISHLGLDVLDMAVFRQIVQQQGQSSESGTGRQAL